MDAGLNVQKGSINKTKVMRALDRFSQREMPLHETINCSQNHVSATALKARINSSKDLHCLISSGKEGG